MKNLKIKNEIESSEIQCNLQTNLKPAAWKLAITTRTTLKKQKKNKALNGLGKKIISYTSDYRVDSNV